MSIHNLRDLYAYRQNLKIGKLNHDALISTISLPPQPVAEVSNGNIEAPKVKHIKHKIVWSEEGIREYQKLLSLTLPEL